MVGPIVDLDAPLERDTIVEVRHGKMKPMPGLTIESGIDKSIVDGPIWVSKTGIDGDEHDMTFHGGPTKAVHAYCSAHYPSWQTSHPSTAPRFTPGAFGENLVFVHLNERNVCIGDIFAVGPSAPSSTSATLTLQVSQPRQPCFKLNHRFGLKNFAPETTRLSRTGWYFRVLEEGWVENGMEIRLVDRKYAEWTLERLQGVLYRGAEGAAEMQFLLGVEELTDEIKGVVRRRLTKLEGATKKKEVLWTDWKVVDKVQQTRRITSFSFAAVHDKVDATPEAGSHVKLRLPNGLVRAYSIVHGSRGRFALGIARDENSRGGSKYLHEHVSVGDILQIGSITPGIKPNAMASNHVFIVAGIGITAFLWLVEEMVGVNWNVQVHYAVRSAEEMPFRTQLEKLGSRAVVYDKSKGERMDVESVIKGMPWNSQVYVCGPRRLMDDAVKAAQDTGLGEKDVHFEAFGADVGGDPFEVVIRDKEDRTVLVTEEETLLEVLQREFGDVVGSSCEVGNCGTCKVKLRCGKVDHRGTALSAEEKESEMLSCVSRGVGKIEIEIGE
ncbi:MOSC domain-containing protein [Paraphaeosphaeria sporulosa]